MEQKPKIYNPASKTPIPAKKLVIAIAIFIVVYQILLMWIWISFPDIDWVLLRFSLSMADVLGYSALLLSMYAYWRFEKSTENEDMEYLHEFVMAMRKGGLEPKILISTMNFLFTIQRNAEAELGKQIPMTTIAEFIGRTQIPATVKKMDHLHKKVGEKKLSWDDVQEGIK